MSATPSHGYSIHRAVFLDRDGVINKQRPDHVKSWDEFEFEAGALDALARLARSDLKVVVISNQSGIGRGLMTEEAVQEIHARMIEQIAQAGGRMDRIYFCPHAPEAGCTCRKPQPTMLYWAAADLGLDLEGSFLVGDWVDDIRAGHSVGCTTLLVRTGRGEQALTELQACNLPLPVIVPNLGAAVDWILNTNSHSLAPLSRSTNCGT